MLTLFVQGLQAVYLAGFRSYVITSIRCKT